MSEFYNGVRSKFELARHGGELVDLTASMVDFDGFNYSDEEETFDIGGAGDSGSIGSGWVDQTGDFAVTENAISRPLLVTGNGKLFDYRYTRQREGSAPKVQSGVLYLQVQHDFEERGRRRFTCSAFPTGVPKRS